MAGAPANASSSSWVVEMEKMLEHADPSAEAARWRKASIYRVPERIKHQTKAEAYQPQLVSLGPFHHGRRQLLPMEEHKRRAMLHLVKRARVPLGDFAAAVEEVADELMDAYDGLDDEQWRCGAAARGRFVEVMLTDGCFLLEMMRTDKLVPKGKPLKEYAPNDPVFSIYGFYFLRPDIQSDMLLMENQLPLLVLQRILAVKLPLLNEMVLRFLDCRPLHEGIGELGLHPLELYHKSFRDLHPDLNGLGSEEDTMPSAVELSEAGIDFKMSATERV